MDHTSAHNHEHLLHQVSLISPIDPLTAAGVAANVGLSFVTSLHCAAMCGPLVIALLTRQRSISWKHALLYNVGRAVSYAAAGLICGSVSQGIANMVPQVGPALAILTSVVLLIYAAKICFSNAVAIPQIAVFRTIVSSLSKAMQRWPYDLQALMLGLFTVLLPCMTLSPALVASLGTQSALKGAIYMFSFFLGTLPVMMLAPILPHTLKLRLSQKTETFLVTVFLVLSAVITFLRAFPDLHHYLHP